MTNPDTSLPRRLTSPLVVTFERGGRVRRVRLDPRASLLIGAACLLIGVWAIAMTLYVLFRDDVVGSLAGGQVEIRQAYEDRISSLRSTVDRLTSRQLLDQNSVEARLRELVARQTALENRQALVASLVGSAETSGRSLAAKNAAAPLPSLVPASAPAADSISPVATPDLLPGGVSSYAPVAAGKPRVLKEDGAPFPTLRGGGEASARPQPAPGRTSALDTQPGQGTTQRLDALAARLATLARQQEAALGGVERRARLRVEKAQLVLAEAGLDRSRFAAAHVAETSGIGGPLVPLATEPADGPFAALVERAQRAIVEAERLGRILETVPLRRPVSGDAELSSGFGARIDPFTRGIALHTGLDFRDEYGAPVRATAPGRIVTAEWTGGYGNMVEVDHGNGLTTRYGHLSAILVSEGQKVETGALLGRVGSTGRSTGPHLHYETRIDGEPVDPLRFLKAALRVASAG